MKVSPPSKMNKWRIDMGKGCRLACLCAVYLCLPPTTDCFAQFGGGGFGGGGQGGAGGPGAPGPQTKPKFRDHIHTQGGIGSRRETGDALVVAVEVIGNRIISTHDILQQLQTRKDRFYSYEGVLSDVRKLNDLGSFDHVTFNTKKTPDGKGVIVSFMVHERAVIERVVFHGNRGLNDRELVGRAGLSPKDPLSEFSIESSRRRLLDYYHEEGFNQASIVTKVGIPKQPGAVVFRINEGPKERIWSISIEGNTILSEARLKKIIKSRGPTAGLLAHIGNTANMDQINADVDILASTYHNLGYLTATVGRRVEYDDSGKWMYVTFVVNEGPRFRINNIQIEGNRSVTTESLQQRTTLRPGDTFDGTQLRKDVGELTYGYGELGFIYAEVQPQTIMRDEKNVVDLVYKIEEGDRWKIRQIRVNIEGEPHLMRESTMLNLVDGLREGDFVDRKKVEIGKRRLQSSQLLENNPQVADAADIIIEPVNKRL